MAKPPEAMPNDWQAITLPATDTRVQEITHAVEVPMLPRKRAPAEDLVGIKVEEDDGVFRKPLATASHAAKRPRARNVGQTNLPRPGLPLTPLSNKPHLRTGASSRIAVSGPFQANTSLLTPPWKQASGTGIWTYSWDTDSTYKHNSEMLCMADSPSIILQSVESDDLQPDEDAISISSELTRQIQSNTSIQSSESNQVAEHLNQSTQKKTHIESPAPEGGDSDDDALQDWRREQIMLNAVLKARDEFSLLPSSWKVHFSGGPSTDRMFYRKVKEKSFRPRIYARCEKYEVTGTYSLS